MKYMSTNEPERFIIDKSMELVGDGHVMVLVPWQYHIYLLHHYAKSRMLIEFYGVSLGKAMFSFTDNCIFFRASKFIADLKSISVRSLIILEPVSSESRKLAIERTRANCDPEIWRVNGF